MWWVALLALSACGRIGFGAPADVDASSTADADAVPTDTAEVACEDLPGILFCDGFESGTLLDFAEAMPPSFVRADVEQVFRGTTSLHARTTRSIEPAWYVGMELPAITSGELHARWYLYYPSSAPNRTFASVHIISNMAPNRGVVFGATNGTVDVSATQNDDIDVSNVVVPLDRWFCVQMHVTIADAGVVETWIDGAPSARLDNVDTLPLGGYTNVHAGLFTAVGGGVNDMWTDELAIGTQPIACL